MIQPNEEGAMTIMRLVEDGPAEESGKVRVNFEFKWNFMRAAGSGSVMCWISCSIEACTESIGVVKLAGASR